MGKHAFCMIRDYTYGKMSLHTDLSKNFITKRTDGFEIFQF